MRSVVLGHATVVDGDLNQGSMNVFGHVGLVATDVEVGASLKPFPNFCSVFLEAMLNVDFLLLVAGPCGCLLYTSDAADE